jgi:hypothetical protein
LAFGLQNKHLNKELDDYDDDEDGGGSGGGGGGGV